MTEMALDPDDEGLGNVRPDEVVPLDPDDEGLGNVRPDEVVPLDPDDEGLGNVRPEKSCLSIPTTRVHRSTSGDPVALARSPAALILDGRPRNARDRWPRRYC